MSMVLPRRLAVNVPRVLLGVALSLVAAGIILLQTPARAIEANILSLCMRPFISGSTVSSNGVVFFGLGTNDVHGLLITGLCSCVVLVVPLTLGAGFILLAIRRVITSRVLIAFAVACSIVISANYARYISAAVAYQKFGIRGFDIVHNYIGSFVVIVCFGFAIVVLVRSAFRHRGNHRQ